jgi:predicted nucleic acid-binding protein
MRETVYLETTVVSYYTSRPSNDIIVLSRQRLTEHWWTEAFERFEVYISEAVIEEAAAGDSMAAAKRLAALESCTLLDIDDEVSRIYNIYLDRLGIPEKAFRDALHMAVATVHRMDYLVTWNCTHIANGETIKRLIAVNSELGMSIPVIVTPEELMKE